MLRALFASILEVVGNLFAGIDSVNYIFGTSPDFIINSTYIFSYYADTKKIKPSKKSDGNYYGSPGLNSRAGDELIIQGIAGQR